MKNFDLVDILIVEDNPQDAELTKRALSKNGLSENIYEVENGAEALDFLFCQGMYQERSIVKQPKVVLLDLKMPKIGGLEVLKAVKSDERTSLIPIVMITSSQEISDIREAYRLGANSYVVKPLEFNEYIRNLGNLGLYWVAVNKTVH